MSKIRAAIHQAADKGEKAMGLFLTNGFPDPESTLPILQAIDRGGADFIELGMPFSDPLAEGLPIQRSSARALQHGIRMADAFTTAERFRAESDTPLLLMGYINPVYRYGVERFCADAAAADVDGLILPDLPPEESALLEDVARDHDLDLVFLIAPNTVDERVAAIDERATAFVYAVSVTGLTGSRLGAQNTTQAYLQRARRLVRSNPLLVGFGIKTHADAVRLSTHTDGFIVGSALIDEVERLWNDDTLGAEERLLHVERFARTLKHGAAVGADAS